MKIFDCDFDLASGGIISSLDVLFSADMEGVQITIVDNIQDIHSLECVVLKASKARELAAELIRLADEIEKQ